MALPVQLPRPRSAAALTVALLHILPAMVDVVILIAMYRIGSQPGAELEGVLAPLALGLAAPVALYLALIVAAAITLRRGSPSGRVWLRVLAVIDLVAGTIALLVFLKNTSWTWLVLVVLALFALGAAGILTSRRPNQRF